MKTSDFNYHLPEQLIAQFPAKNRRDARLLVVMKDGQFVDHRFASIESYIRSGDTLVLNDTKVIPARLFGKKDSGGSIEILLERVLSKNTLLAQIRASRSPKPGQQLTINNDPKARLTVVARQGEFFKIEMNEVDNLYNWLEQVGHVPLPPYIERDDEAQDLSRYQTVYAHNRGAVAAPTAGLHYDEQLLGTLQNKGVKIEKITLHVGAGTYQPVRVDELTEHKMHREWCELSASSCETINRCKKDGGRIMAVGTTVVRVLESARWNSNQEIQPFSGDTDIFIYPGYRFRCVDMLQTNFHLPQSTLLMLVSAFAGQTTIKAAYQHAIKQQYRFFSYGDSMLLYCAATA